MSHALRALRTALQLLPIALVLVVLVPGSAVQPTTLTLTKVTTAEGYDAGSDVVWVLVLGEDSVHDTDAIQLLGIDARTGAAAGIGIPRDSWVDLGGGEMGKINQAYGEDADAERVSEVVRELVGITADYVLATAGDGFVSMVDALGGVTVVSSQAFVTDDRNMQVDKGPNEFTGDEALDFAMTRDAFPDVPGDFVRSENHQALLLGLLKQLQRQDGDRGFVELMALSALEGLDTDASPVDLYRLLNVLTGVDPDQVEGCIVVGREDVDARGNQIIVPDDELAERLGREAAADATFESGCEPR
ncbi:LCP family protein [Nocardioides sp. SR21]|uniref:LCP family protein n=1 Tax=Nocardioides sp. SR21 TaxID=2919501 RepID=UPI001FAAD46F|nr:LCP family protein [Nocardioides sp. SR21]